MIGILLVNLGTPAAPTLATVRNYLAEFLWDPRVVELPRALWWLILHGLVLRIRPRRAARLYQKIWTPHGSPLLSIGLRQCTALQTLLTHSIQSPVTVVLGMRYGMPSIAEALDKLRSSGMRRLLVLPLYPQYASATTGSAFDAVTEILRTWRWVPELRMIGGYHNHPAYLDALAQSLLESWATSARPERLLFSFHGLPERAVQAGDPYEVQCRETAQWVANRLDLRNEAWAVAFQSRFGRAKWIGPATDRTLQNWAAEGIKSVTVICPGFSADCLETLEEVAIQYRDLFLEAGGQTYQYVSALNDRPDHLRALADLIRGSMA